MRMISSMEVCAGRNQRSIEEVGLKPDLILVAILVERLHDALPVFLFRTARHHAFALHLNIQEGAFGSNA